MRWTVGQRASFLGLLGSYLSCINTFSLYEQYNPLITVIYDLQDLSTFAFRFETSDVTFIYYSRREYLCLEYYG